MTEETKEPKKQASLKQLEETLSRLEQVVIHLSHHSGGDNILRKHGFEPLKIRRA